MTQVQGMTEGPLLEAAHYARRGRLFPVGAQVATLSQAWAGQRADLLLHESKAVGQAALVEELRGLMTRLPEGGVIRLTVPGYYGTKALEDLKATFRAQGGAFKEPAFALDCLRNLPAESPLRQDREIAEQILAGEEAVFALLSAPPKPGFKVEEVAEAALKAGLIVTAFVEPLRYDPAVYQGGVAEEGLPWLAACALAEDLSGGMAEHRLYVTRPGESTGQAYPDSDFWIPCWKNAQAASLGQKLAEKRKIELSLGALQQRFVLPEGAGLLASKIDGVKSLKQLQSELSSDFDEDKFHSAFKGLMGSLGAVSMLFLYQSSDEV